MSMEWHYRECQWNDIAINDRVINNVNGGMKLGRMSMKWHYKECQWNDIVIDVSAMNEMSCWWDDIVTEVSKMTLYRHCNGCQWNDITMSGIVVNVNEIINVNDDILMNVSKMQLRLMEWRFIECQWNDIVKSVNVVIL